MKIKDFSFYQSHLNFCDLCNFDHYGFKSLVSLSAHKRSLIFCNTFILRGRLETSLLLLFRVQNQDKRKNLNMLIVGLIELGDA